MRAPDLPPFDGRECLIDRWAALAEQHGVLDLTGAGDDRPPAPELLAALARGTDGALRYPDFAGDRALREVVAAERSRRDGRATDAGEVVVTPGATGGVAAALTVLLGPGDELVTFAPGYTIPLRVALGRSARVRVAPLSWTRSAERAAWTFDPARLADLFGARTRVLLLTSPHSPTGKVFTQRELELVVALCRARGVFVVHDAVYESFELCGPAPSPRALYPEGTLVVGSASKAARVPGVRVGWVTAPRGLAARIAKLQEATTAGANLPAQRALAECASAAFAPRPSGELAALHERVRVALGHCGLEVLPAEGGPCCVARAAGHMDARPASDLELAGRLLARGLAGVPLCEFEPSPATAAELGPAVRIGFVRGPTALARLEALARPETPAAAPARAPIPEPVARS